MENKISIENLIQQKLSIRIALFTFSIGTILFASYFLLKNNDLLIIIGIYYILFAFVVNGFILLNLIYQFFIKPNEKHSIIIQILFIMGNIPIAIIYFYLVLNSFNNSQLF